MNFKHLIKIKRKKIQCKSIIFSEDTGEWCLRPYPDHPKGCPNYNKNHLCPPNTPQLEDLIIDYDHFHLIYAEFDFAEYKKLRKQEQPNWTVNQVKCVLYWQNSVKKLLKEKIEQIIDPYLINNILILGCGSGMKIKDYKYDIYSMEAMGVNVFSTLKLNNINFEIRPKNKIILCCLLCSKKELKIIKQIIL